MRATHKQAVISEKTSEWINTNFGQETLNIVTKTLNNEGDAKTRVSKIIKENIYYNSNRGVYELNSQRINNIWKEIKKEVPKKHNDEIQEVREFLNKFKKENGITTADLCATYGGLLGEIPVMDAWNYPTHLRRMGSNDNISNFNKINDLVDTLYLDYVEKNDLNKGLGELRKYNIINEREYKSLLINENYGVKELKMIEEVLNKKMIEYLDKCPENTVLLLHIGGERLNLTRAREATGMEEPPTHFLI